MSEDPGQKLMQKAGALLARRPFSRAELAARLARYGDPAQIDPVLDRLEELNLLNDAEYAYNSAVRWLQQQGWGALRVLHMLRRRHIDAATAEAALARARLEIGERAALEAYLERRARTHPLPSDRRAITRLVAHLRRRGFPDEVIWTVLPRKIPGTAWRNFDLGD